MGDTLNLPSLWHLNRHNAPPAVAIGFFCAWLPIPFHTLLSVLLAIAFRVNVPLTLLAIFISNPLTMGPMYYFAYKVGVMILGSHAYHFNFEPSLYWLTHGLLKIWKPFLLGSVVTASVSALLGYYGTHLLWRIHILQHLKARRKRHKTNVS